MRSLLILLLLVLYNTVIAQQRDLPRELNPDRFYLFYLHGGVVTVKGDNAINDPVPQFGPYQFSRILDTLGQHGFTVVSERRMRGIDDTVYALKIFRQVDTLIKAGVPVKNVLLVGASSGSNVVLLAADKIRDPQMKYVIMGGCASNLYKEYLTLQLPGYFLSIIEQSDEHGPCENIFKNRPEVKRFEEVTLDTGLDHGFIYKPFAAWVNAVIQWFEKNTTGYVSRKAALIDGK